MADANKVKLTRGCRIFFKAVDCGRDFTEWRFVGLRYSGCYCFVLLLAVLVVHVFVVDGSHTIALVTII